MIDHYNDKGLRFYASMFLAVTIFNSTFLAAANEIKTKVEIEKWLGNYIDSALKKAPAAGLSILVGQGDKVIFSSAYGLADLENNTPSKIETVYQIGSLTKQFTSVAILQLEEHGKLRLEDDITTLLPDYTTHGKKITIENLLSHTSGIKNYIKVGYSDSKIAPGRIVNDADYRLDLRANEMLKFFENEPLEFDPGTAWNYSNAGYYLAGLIIEKASGLSYSMYIESMLMKPSSMHNSSYTNYENIVKDRARGYKVKDGHLLNANSISMAIPYAAGALSSTVTDLFRWNRVLHATNQLLNTSSYSKLTTTGKLRTGEKLPLNYALGVAVTIRDGHKCIVHPGGINGFSSVLSYFPENEITIVVLTNTYNKKARAFADKVELDLGAFLFSAEVSKFDFRIN